MGVTDEYLTYVVDQLGHMVRIEVKRMFGGASIYCDGVMFALVADDVLYLKVDDSNRPDFDAVGMKAFQPFPEKATRMSYYEVPGDVLEQKAVLGPWAQKALRIAEEKGKR